MILLLNASLLMLVAIIAAAVYAAPVFTYSLLGICLLSLLYILTEKWTTHNAAEFENRFWTSIACLLAYNCVFTKDSPVKFPADQPVLGWTVVIVFTYLAHIYDRHLRRVVLSRIPKIRRIESAEFPSEHRANAKHKLGELRRLLNSIDLRWMSSTFQVRARVVPFVVPRQLRFPNAPSPPAHGAEHLPPAARGVHRAPDHQHLPGGQHGRAEPHRHERRTRPHPLQGSSVTCLHPSTSILTAEPSTPLLCPLAHQVKDHRLSRQLNRTKLLQTLAVDRLGELNVSSRAMLLDAIQVRPLSTHLAPTQSHPYLAPI